MTGAIDCNDFSRSLTFTYNPAQDGFVVIQGGLTSGATGIIETYDGNVFNMEINESSNGGVRSFSGWVEECQEYKITINWIFEKYNPKNDKRVLSESGPVIGDWNIKMFNTEDPQTRMLINELIVDPMICGDYKVAQAPLIP